MISRIDNFIVVDLEATCGGHIKNEIIEIGAVKLDGDLNYVSEFDEFVKPIINPILTKFCTELTSISQENINSADTFPIVLKRFINWMGPDIENRMLVSWGDYDKRQFKRDCSLHNLKSDWIGNHLNCKKFFSKHMKTTRLYGLSNAISLIGESFSGTHHRGIDDAKNVVTIMRYIYN